jgi:tetratricopeptide (TPR) repeat protein
MDNGGLIKKLDLIIRSKTDRHLVFLSLFVLALTVKIAIFFLATDPIIFGKYPYFAERIARGLDIGERLVDLSPAYLYISVIFFRIFGPDWELLAILQIFIGSLTCVIIYAIGKKLFNQSVGAAAALILALYGNLALIELTLEPEAFVLFFNALAVLSLILAQNDPLWKQYSTENVIETADRDGVGIIHRRIPIMAGLPWKWFAAGMLLGLSVITKPNALLMIPGALIWIWWNKISANRRIMATVSLLLGAALLISPVTLRNYTKFHDVILVSADGGKVFFHGNGAGATGMDRADLPFQGFLEEGQSEPDYAHTLFRSTARSLSGKPLKPSECSKFWFRYTLKDMASHPAAAFSLEIRKFFLFWSNYEVHDIDSTYKSYIAIQSWPLIPFGAIATLGIIGMIITRKHFRDAFLLYWMILVFLSSVLVFFAASRYRLPAVPYLSIFAALALSGLYRQMRGRQWRTCGVYAAAVVIFAAGTELPFRNDIAKFDRWQQASRIHYSLGGIMFFKKGAYKEAVAEFKRALAIDPNFLPAYNYLGKSYAILGDYDHAEEAFLRVIRYAPTVDEGYMNLGILYELQGKTPQAIKNLKHAIALNPNNEKARSHLQALTTQ